MPTRYIGRQPFFKGKTLYDICRQLRNLGEGRVVYRTSFNEIRWPEQTTYVRLTKVVPDMTCPAPGQPSVSEAWGRLVYRGKDMGEVKLRAGHKPDWALVPKDEEESFCQIQQAAPSEGHPDKIGCPPLLEIILKQELTARNGEAPDKIEVPFVSEPADKEIRRLLL